MLAMAPTTNIGSSTPIDSSGAEPRQRPAAQGDQRLRASLTRARGRRTAGTRRGRAGRAQGVEPHGRSRRCSMNVIDLVAPSLPALLAKLDGYGRRTPQRPYTLHLAGAQIDDAKPGFFTRLLNTLIDPNLSRCSSSPASRGSASRSSTPASSCPVRSARSRCCPRSSASRCCRSRGRARADPARRRAARDRRARPVARRADASAGSSPRASGIADAVPRRAGAVPHLGAARRPRSRVALGGFLVFALGKAVQVRRSRSRSAAPAIVGADGGRARRRARSSSTASSGGRAAPTDAARAGRAGRSVEAARRARRSTRRDRIRS